MKLFGPEGGVRLTYGSIGRTALEAALALTTGILLARFAWVVIAPGFGSAPIQAQHMPTLAGAEATTSRLALLTQSDPFRAESDATSNFVVPTSLNLKIAGLRWSDGTADSSSAVLILPDNTQKRVAAGEQIVSGAVLESIAADRIFLRFNGQRQELLLHDPGKPLFAAKGARAETASTPSSRQQQSSRQDSASSPPAITPTLLLTDIDLYPELRNGAISGYRLAPRGQGYFQAAGLEAGDLVLRVNGNSLEGMGPEAIQAAVMSSDAIALDVVRNGTIIRLRLSPESGLSQ
ncbi:MAG: hypothetical protein CVT79_01400 [Alphaproteobacteria bacterium HGW-Alphaproteobacteria-18]|nr:MAG: hypothetical protein CVT79_01400 [Alphaproteobacteria bacterium HGW-Alphaproteobacteria-18]